MPEGPEIRRAADHLADAVAGQRVTLAFFAFPELAPFQESLVGRRIEAIVPHGKALLTRFDDGHTLYSHNQLYGVWKVAPPGQRPEGPRSLRVALETAERAILLYSASDVQMWRTDRLAEHPFLSRLGPDVLDASLDTAAVMRRLKSPAFSGKVLSALLLDQAFLAGMGNYLRSEVLFEAGIAPGRRPLDLDAAERRAWPRPCSPCPGAATRRSAHRRSKARISSPIRRAGSGSRCSTARASAARAAARRFAGMNCPAAGFTGAAAARPEAAPRPGLSAGRPGG